MTSTGALTSYGITALAAATQGNYTPPLYLVIENNGSTLAASASAGATQVQTNAPVHLSGDTKIVVGAGLASEEVATFIGTPSTVGAVTTYTLSAPLANSHAAADPICRLPLTSDTMLQVVNEIEYDHANDPGQRLQSVNGYSTGNGQWTMQFFLTGIEANSFLMTVGLSDSPVIGQGNLHAHMVVGVDHTYDPAAGGVDIELDIPISIAAS